MKERSRYHRKWFFAFVRQRGRRRSVPSELGTPTNPEAGAFSLHLCLHSHRIVDDPAVAGVMGRDTVRPQAFGEFKRPAGSGREHEPVYLCSGDLGIHPAYYRPFHRHFTHPRCNLLEGFVPFQSGAVDRNVRHLRPVFWASSCPQAHYNSSVKRILQDMDFLTNISLGFSVALTPLNVLYAMLGAIVGTSIGVLPGLGAPQPSPAASCLLRNGTHIGDHFDGRHLFGAMYGCSTTSILLNIPGEAASVVTCMDGYQMARNGQAGPALGMSAIGSFIGATISILALTFVAPRSPRLPSNSDPPNTAPSSSWG